MSRITRFTRLRWVGAAALLVVTPLLGAQAPDLNALLREVEEAARQGGEINREREARFVRQRSEQQTLLREAEAEQKSAQARIDAIREDFEAQQEEIQALKAQLRDNVGELDQMYAGIRQTASDLRGTASESLITAQTPERLDLLDRLADGRELPEIDDLEALWITLLEQAVEAGRSVRFDADVVQPDGDAQRQSVVRVGPFTAMSQGRYLSLDGDGRLIALPQQPSWAWTRTASAFEEAESGTELAMIDPSRGSLLRVEGERPDLLERIRQGGAVGLLILVIGFIGIVIALVQWRYLATAGSRMRRQLADRENPKPNNPLGRLLLTFSNDTAPPQDAELIELRLSESVLKETPRIERAQSLVKLFAAVAPLLGLLGTVTGMIATFQAITVFGTGDPKLMAGGISQALVTTVLGLVAAIPLLFLNSLLVARAKVLIQMLDEASAVMLADRMERLP
ncbi:MotA/TolQ/ExbB proton channel family protein [Polycyclovorans algicola]|uniref:MotA/TolQ/ExbB proton channel family protein n=1 Tax=Polycyclovorans algicola TaxID=616992 RepID=UPI000693CD2C|nr:MotA/TolQ/ExbB proton channel family protein [Polycyclovorans algicola]